MDNISVVPFKSATRKVVDDFTMTAFYRDSGHSFQIFVDCGGDPGPWLAIGLNDTVYTIGWLPETYRNRGE